MEGLLGFFGVRWVFSQWTGDFVSISPTINVPMDGPKHISAVWREDYLMLLLLMIFMQALLFFATAFRGLYERARD